MSDTVTIRRSEATDTPVLEQVYREAFPDEDLVPLLRDLLVFGPDVLSLVALNGDDVVGHACFTACTVGDGSVVVSLLGPLAVAPAVHKQGIGSRLVHAGLDHVKQTDAVMVCVLGDPNYYGRFGFVAERSVAPPHPLPPEWDGAWQSIQLGDDADAVNGVLSVPEPWTPTSLWSP